MRDWGDFRKLFEKPSPAFERLPYASRCMAADIIRRCDRLGRIIPGDNLDDQLIDDLAFHVRAHPGEEQFIRECVSVLLADRYFVFDDGYLTIRNFVDAQRTASAERMALKRARDAAAGMGEPDDSEADADQTPGHVPRDTGDERDASDANAEPGVTCAPLAGARAGLVSSGLVSSGLVSGSAEQVGTRVKSGSTRARPVKTTEHVPAVIPETWVPSDEQVAALAEKWSAQPRRILAEVREFRWYWRDGKGKGKRATLRGWAQTFANRIENLAKTGALYVHRPGDPSVDSQTGQDDAEARRKRAAEVEARARAARDAKRGQGGGEAA
jgi:hypothetical protein